MRNKPTKPVQPGPSRSSLFGQRATAGAVRVRDCDGAKLQAAIGAACECGDAVAFSLTADRGAISVTLLSEGVGAKRYATTVEELEEALDAILALCVE